jgi:hypothetical protein
MQSFLNAYNLAKVPESSSVSPSTFVEASFYDQQQSSPEAKFRLDKSLL